MSMRFIETTGFTRWVVEFLDDQDYGVFQQQLIADPTVGSLIPGCGGLRKVRLAIPRRGRGRRGGARVIYLHVPEADWIFLLDVYGKEEKEDLRPAEKKVLKQLVNQLMAEARQAAARFERKEGT
jgi:hypothetical protein